MIASDSITIFTTIHNQYHNQRNFSSSNCQEKQHKKTFRHFTLAYFFLLNKPTCIGLKQIHSEWKTNTVETLQRENSIQDLFCCVEDMYRQCKVLRFGDRLRGGGFVLTPVLGNQQSPSHPEREQPCEHAGGETEIWAQILLFVSYYIYMHELMMWKGGRGDCMGRD